MEELRKGPARPKFGTLEQIRGTEFVQKVTNAGEGIWVVCLLYKDRCGAAGREAADLSASFSLSFWQGERGGGAHAAAGDNLHGPA